MNPRLMQQYMVDANNQGTFSPEPTGEAFNPMALPDIAMEKSKAAVNALRGSFGGPTYIDPAKMQQQGLTAGGEYPAAPVAPAAPPPTYTPGTDAFAGGRTLRPGYEVYGPMSDAEFASLQSKTRR